MIIFFSTPSALQPSTPFVLSCEPVERSKGWGYPFVLSREPAERSKIWGNPFVLSLSKDEQSKGDYRRNN